MSYIIKIDNRERSLIDFLQKDGYAFDVETLDVGDIQVVDKESKSPIIIIERKTYSDLEASIKDGRYKEQKERLLKAYPYKVRKILLLEGDAKKFKMDKKVLNGVIVNSMLRDNISVYCTKNFEEFTILFETILINLPKYCEEIIKSVKEDVKPMFENELDAYTYSVKSNKKENVTPKICFRNMLCQINGISNTIADTIVETYNNMNEFYKYYNEKYQNNYLEMVKELSEMKYGKNNRKIGKIAENIINQMYGSNVIIDEKKKSSKKKELNILNVFSDE